MQKLVVMLATSLYAAKQNDEIVRSAADIVCQDLTRELTGKPTERSLFPRHHLARRVASPKASLPRSRAWCRMKF